MCAVVAMLCEMQYAVICSVCVCVLLLWMWSFCVDLWRCANVVGRTRRQCRIYRIIVVLPLSG
jgi:hypothetical protein